MNVTSVNLAIDSKNFLVTKLETNQATLCSSFSIRQSIRQEDALASVEVFL